MVALPLGWALVHSQEKGLKWPLLPPQPLSGRACDVPTCELQQPRLLQPSWAGDDNGGTEGGISARGEHWGLTWQGLKVPMGCKAATSSIPRLQILDISSTNNTSTASFKRGGDRGHAALTWLGK